MDRYHLPLTFWARYTSTESTTSQYPGDCRKRPPTPYPKVKFNQLPVPTFRLFHLWQTNLIPRVHDHTINFEGTLLLTNDEGTENALQMQTKVK